MCNNIHNYALIKKIQNISKRYFYMNCKKIYNNEHFMNAFFFFLGKFSFNNSKWGSKGKKTKQKEIIDYLSYYMW